MPSEAFPLPKARYGVAISWDCAKATVDLDLQALIVDNHGLIVDAVYYNNLSAFDGCIGHSGDKRLADNKEYCESVWVNLTKLPQQVALVIFVVAAFGDCMLKDVTGGKISVLEDWVGYRVKESRIERAMADVDAVFMMRRQEGGAWQLFELEEPPSTGSHFLDILEPTIGDLIRKEIPGAPAVQKVTFLMEKGCAVDFAQNSKLKRLTVGIGGKLPRGFTGSIDLDVSAVVFSKAGKIIGAVDCDTCEKFGVSHSGDFVAGHSIGDDEVITIDLGQVPQKASQIFFLLNVRGGHTFQAVESAYARIADQACVELARYETSGGAAEKGLIIARIFRNSEKRWSLQALGMFCMAECWQEASEILKQLFNESPEKAQGSSNGAGMPTSRRFCRSQMLNARKSAAIAAKRRDNEDKGLPAKDEAATAEEEEEEEEEKGEEEEEEEGEEKMFMVPTRSNRGSRCVTAAQPERSGTMLGDAVGTPIMSRRRSLVSESGCETPAASKRTTVRKGTFRLHASPEEPGGGRDGSSEVPKRLVTFDIDTDVVQIQDEDVTTSTKSRGLCVKGCRMPFLSSCMSGEGVR